MARLSSCGTRASLLCGTGDLPRSWIEPISPALAGRLVTAEPSGEPLKYLLLFFLRGRNVFMLAFLFLIFLFFLKAFITVANQMLLILQQQSRCLGFHYIIRNTVFIDLVYI